MRGMNDNVPHADTVLVIGFIMVNQTGMVPAFMENNSIEEKQ